MIQVSGRPIAAPSANKFGRISPTTAAHVKKQLPDVDYILDGGKTTVGIESTIIRLTPAGFQILRNGVITREDLETVLPFDESPVVSDIAAPGMLKSHYSPRKAPYCRRSSLGDGPFRAGLISLPENMMPVSPK